MDLLVLLEMALRNPLPSPLHQRVGYLLVFACVCLCLLHKLRMLRMLRRAKEFQPCSTVGQDTLDTLKNGTVCLLCVYLCTPFPISMITGQSVKPSAILGLNCQSTRCQFFLVRRAKTGKVESNWWIAFKVPNRVVEQRFRVIQR